MAAEKDQIDVAVELQILILEDFKELLTTRKDELTATDRATIVRLLQANGWSIDPAALPEDLKGMLTRNVAFDDDDTPELSLAK